MARRRRGFALFDGRNGCGVVYRSADDGATWLPVTDLPLHADSFAFDPADPRNIWAATGDVFFVPSAVYRWSDAGASWVPANVGLEGSVPLQLAIDATGRRLYSATGAGVFDLEVIDSLRSVISPGVRLLIRDPSVRGPEAPALKASRAS